MASGIICEYNPFHNGHLYQLQETRRRTGDQDIVCIMSGNYVQRGEPAIADKWVRTRMALAAGADLVIELPTVYSTAGAAHFALGSVSLAEKSGIIDTLCFGTEHQALDILEPAARAMVLESDRYEALLSDYLGQSLSFASAREKALGALLPDYPPEKIEALTVPNAILGLEYLLCLFRSGSRIKPLMLPRQARGYKDPDIHSPFASALALREQIRQGHDITDLLPEETQNLWDAAVSQGLAPVLPDAYSAALNYILSLHDPATLSQVAAVAEGLENRILREAADYPGWEELTARIATKRYPTARLRRILLHTLLGINEDYRRSVGFEEGPGYIRVLGFRKEKEALLSRLTQNSRLPVVLSYAHPPVMPEPALAMLRSESRFTDIYAGGLSRPDARGRGFEYRAPLIVAD